MKFTISKTDLSDALSITSKGRSARATLPILSGVYIKASGGDVVFQTTDLEISVKHTTKAMVEEDGETVVSGKLIVEIVKNLADAAITCTYQDNQFSIDCLNSHFSMSTMDPADFPSFPNIELADSIELPAASVAHMVKKVSKAISRDESHAILTGINLTVENEDLCMVATDSYRLAISEDKVPEHQGTYNLVIPGSTFDEVCRLLPDSGEMKIGYSENQIMFEFGDSVFITRKLEGNYPNYRQIIPKENVVTAIIDTQNLKDAVKRASIMAQEYMQVKLDISSEAQQIEISSKVADIGGANEKIDAQIEGEDIVIGFNYQYLMDGLNSIDTEEVMFEANSPLKPGVLKAVGGDNFFYLSMPVKLNN